MHQQIPVATTLRPWFLARVAGLPFQTLAHLRAPRTQAAAEALRAIEGEIADGRDHVSAALHEAIGALTDRQLRHRLLDVRRQLFNGKAVSGATLDALPASVRGLVAEYNKSLQARDHWRNALAAAYGEELVAARRTLRERCMDPDFQKGVLLSSPTLFDSLRRYLASDPGRPTSRDEQVQRGLLRYLVRTATKATPFARLCTVIEGRFASASHDGHGSGAAVPRFIGDPRRKIGFVRLNKGLHAALWPHLVQRPAVRSSLSLDLNSTLVEEDGRWCFLHGVNGREAFQRVARNPAVDLVVDLVRSERAATFASIRDRLMDDPIVETTRDEAEEYLARLIAIGFLHLRRIIPEQEADWDVPLARFLATIPDEHAEIAAAMLVDLRAMVGRYASSDGSDRAAISRALGVRLAETFERLGLAGGIPRDLPLFEDSTADAELVVAVTDPVQRALDSLARYSEAVRPLAYPRVDQATMRRFFDCQYPEADAVPLLRFYEDFHRGYLKGYLAQVARARANPQAGALRQIDPNPFRSDTVACALAALTRVQDMLRSRWRADPMAEEIDISPRTLAAVIGDLPRPPRDCHSFAVFCQLVRRPDGEVRIMAPGGGLITGYGKFYSRFLYMFPESVRLQLLAENASLTTDCLAEICGDEDFNANLHPPLLPEEIGYPGREGTPGPERLRCGDLVVAPDALDVDNLTLVHLPSGRRVLPIDLGFMNPQLRPALYQLLAHFSPGTSFGLPLPESLVGSARAKPADPSSPPSAARSSVLYRPRITYDRQIVLARRRWTVPGAELPRPTPTEDDASYFGRLDDWRRSVGLPQEAYVRLRPPAVGRVQPAGEQSPPVAAPEADKIDDDASEDAADVPHSAARSPVGRRARRGQHKPQYVDFASPMLVTLLARAAGRLPQHDAVFDECYPTRADLPLFGEEAYAYEVVLELISRAPVAASGPDAVTDPRAHCSMTDTATAERSHG